MSNMEESHLSISVMLPNGTSFSAQGPAATVLKLYEEWKAVHVK